MLFAEKIKQLREENQMLRRKIAAGSLYSLLNSNVLPSIINNKHYNK
jgi:hypothetical protein